MADKMITDGELRDDFLSAVIRSEEPARAPEGFLDGVMCRIGMIPDRMQVRPYRPPAWLKWGIPGIIVAIYLMIFIWGSSKESGKASPVLSMPENILDAINSWFSGLLVDFRLPEPHIPIPLLWILAGVLVLGMSFWLLSVFLERRDG